MAKERGQSPQLVPAGLKEDFKKRKEEEEEANYLSALRPKLKHVFSSPFP